MISSITLATASGGTVTLHSTAIGAKTVATRAEGFQGTPPIRAVITDRSQAHGSYIRSKWTQHRSLTVECEILDSTIEAAMDTFDTIAAALYDAIDTPRTLRWTRDAAGQQLQADVRLGELQPLTFTGGAPFVTFQATLLASDPRVYGQSQTVSTGAALTSGAGGKRYDYTYSRSYDPSTGGTVPYNTITAGGSVPTPPIIRIYGFCTAPQVILESTGERIALTGDIQNGDFIEIDCAERTVKLNGTVNRSNLLDVVNSTFFELPIESGNVQLLSSNFDSSARADLLFRPAFT